MNAAIRSKCAAIPNASLGKAAAGRAQQVQHPYIYRVRICCAAAGDGPGAENVILMDYERGTSPTKVATAEGCMTGLVMSKSFRHRHQKESVISW